MKTIRGQKDPQIPDHEKLKSLLDAERFLKPGVTFAELDKLAYAMSDLEANCARDQLFNFGEKGPLGWH